MTRDFAGRAIVVHRAKADNFPELPDGEIRLEPPPEIPEVRSDGFQQVLMYLPMLAMTVGMATVMSASSTGPLQYVGGGAMALGMGGMALSQLGRGRGERKSKLNGQRRDYLRYLGQVRAKTRQAAAAQREALEWANPDPRALTSLLIDPELRRVWERRPTGQDFTNVRIGTGTQPLAVRLVPPETKPVDDLDPLCAGALRRFIRAHGSVPGLPVGIRLRAFAQVSISGDRKAAYEMVCAIVAHLAVFHSPDDVRISVCSSYERLRSWQWIKWLPHNRHPEETDGAGPVRLFAPTLPMLETMLSGELADRQPFPAGGASVALPYHVVIFDGGTGLADSALGTDGADGAVLIDLSAASTGHNALRLHVTAEAARLLSTDRTGTQTSAPLGAPDSLPLAAAVALARQLAPLRSAAGGPADDPLAADTTLLSLLGLPGPADLDIAALHQSRSQRARLRVAIGNDPDGRPVELDIKESAQGGMGPHGLVIGATGSGKSELLRTLVLGLALTHPPEELNFVLVDFKGGATFLGLEPLPHVSAVITNLADELPLVDRMREALNGELVRRQELLRTTGGFASLRAYSSAREHRPELPEVPSLFVVIDEFSELLSARPEFIDLFVMIGRLGRSLGVHLLLASQRLEEGRLRGLETHLSYRIGLRTFAAAESRVVLGVPDAYELPPQPGNGYLKFDTEAMTRFKAAYVSGPATGEPVRRRHRAAAQVVAFAAGHVRQPAIGRATGIGTASPTIVISPARQVIGQLTGGQPATGQPATGQPAVRSPAGAMAPAESLLNAVVGRLAGHGTAARQIWLPPLGVAPALGELLPQLTGTEHFGFTTTEPGRRGRLQAVTGIVDRPFDQRRDPLWADLSAGAGHAAVVGAPRSGKSTTLRTLICSLALLNTPHEAQFYCLDFGGGSLAGLAGLPHVGGVATRQQAERVRRTVAEVQSLLASREVEFAQQGIESISAYRRMRASGEIAGDGFGDVFLVVDGWLTLRQDFEQLEPEISALAARGLGYGVHILAATNKWSEFKPGIRDLFGTRLELRLGDPYESEIDRRLAMNVPEDSPGRGITRDGLHFLTALPQLGTPGQLTSAEAAAAGSSPADLTDGARKLVHAVGSAWSGPRARPVRLLPSAVPASALAQPSQSGRNIPFGIEEGALSQVVLNFDAEPHFVVFGDSECGKSNLLRLIAAGITARYSPDEARIMFVDYRRSLLEVAESPLQIGYAASSAAAGPLITGVREAMAVRMPPADVTPQQLRSRSWWAGSDLFLIVDDYDLVSGGSNPLLQLAELIPQARDIGLHLILARSAGGAGRAMLDPLIQRIREMGSPGLIMSGSRDEGALFGGVRAQAQPPGRGLFTERRVGVKLVQTAILEASADAGRP